MLIFSTKHELDSFLMLLLHNKFQDVNILILFNIKRNGAHQMSLNNTEHLPLISIIVPIFNCEKYIPQCVTSLITQTYHNTEILLINDGSTDSSGLLCDNYKEDDNRITVIHQNNSGVSSARNQGLARVNGDYIAFVDADDYLSPDYIQSLYSNINDADISICGYYRFSDSVPPRESLLSISPELSHDELYHYVLCNNHIGGYLWNKLFHSKIVIENNIRFNTTLRIGEDMLWITEYLKHTNTGIYIPTPLYYYRNNSASTLQSSFHSKTFNSRTITNLDAADLIATHLQKESSSVLASMSYRHVRTCMWLFFNMIACSHYDKELLKRIHLTTRKNLSPYLKADESKFLEKIVAACIATSSVFTFKLASTLIKCLPESFINKYLN